MQSSRFRNLKVAATRPERQPQASRLRGKPCGPLREGRPLLLLERGCAVICVPSGLFLGTGNPHLRYLLQNSMIKRHPVELVEGCKRRIVQVIGECTSIEHTGGG